MQQAAIIDGKALAQALIQSVRAECERLTAGVGLVPGLAVVLVGDDPASHVYVRNKIRTCREVGIRSFDHPLPSDTSQAEILDLIDRLNADNHVHGILVQMPLPGHIDSEAILSAIRPEKDVDGFHVVNVGKLASGSREGLVPCTPVGCVRLIKSVCPDLTGRHAVIVGRSNIVGKPLAQLLLREDCTVTIAHSKTHDLPAVCRTADILVAAVGKPRMVEGSWIKKGAIVIDVGINRIDIGGGKAKLLGDVDFDAALSVASAVTPVPGGVGPMTIACLLRNTLIAACRSRGLPASAV